jgi:N-acetylmuramoyl-L-alanine amidase
VWRSPNFGARRGGLLPEYVVIHYTAMESCAAAAARLCDPEVEVSAHYLIDYDGTVHTLVAETERAWHAGAGQWCGLDDMNSRSIGIELANDGFEPFAEPQLAALEDLLRQIMARWSMPPAAVIGHSDMAPGRKFDPGPRFDWQRLSRQGLAIWPEALPDIPLIADAALFQTLAEQVGYSSGMDVATVLQAVRLRFRPWAKGPLDAVDMGLICDLAKLPVDRGAAPA